MTAQWLPRAEWDRLVRGEGCPMCADLASGEVLEPDHANRFGHTVAELDTGVLRLASDQFSDGYSVVICRRHGPEPHDLAPDEQRSFMADVVRAGEAVQRAFGAHKINYMLLGNAVPHLHCHVIPRYHGDPAPGWPLLGDPDNPVTLSDDEYRARVLRIRDALR